MNWDIFLTYVLPAVIAGAVSLLVCFINNHYLKKMKMLEWEKQYQNDTKAAEIHRQEQVCSALSTYLSATSEYINQQSIHTKQAWLRAVETVFFFAPTSTHEQIQQLNDFLLEDDPNNYPFYSRESRANEMLSELRAAFTTLMNKTE